MKPILLAALLAVVLVGCDPVDPNTPPSATPTATSTVGVTPTPEPTSSEEAAPSATVALSELTLSAEGLGPIVVGESVPEAALAAGIAMWDPTFCGWDPPSTDHGGWKPNYPLTPVNGNYAFYLQTSGNTAEAPIAWLSVISDEIHTVDGLGVGSTIAEVNAVYGSAIAVVPNDSDMPAHVVQGVRGELIFWGTDVVDVIDVFPAGAQPEFYYEIGGCE